LPPAENFEDQWVEYELAGTTFAITNMIDQIEPGARGGFVAVEVENLDDAVAEMKGKDVPFILETADFPTCRMAVVADPNGNGITLHQIKSRAPTD
jgi:predicted enzyme related to lactoylglutathione lyase